MQQPPALAAPKAGCVAAASAAQRRTPDAQRWLSQKQTRYARAMPPEGRDLELVGRANRGEAAALEALYQRYRGFLFRHALRRLGNSDDAADVVQDAFMILFGRFPGFALTVSMETFLYGVLDNLCRKRYARRRPTLDIDEIGGGEEPLAPTTADSDADAARLLSRLMPEQRQLLSLRYVDDRSLRQLAAALGAPVGTIKSRLHRALRALREQVETSSVAKKA